MLTETTKISNSIKNIESDIIYKKDHGIETAAKEKLDTLI